MISKKTCHSAKKRWEKSTSDFKKLTKLLHTNSSFNFSKADCEWLKKWNDNHYFRTYMGIDENEKLILIIAPLSKKGKEVDLEEYLAVPYTRLTRELVLIEEDVITITKKAVLSTELELVKYTEETDKPIFNEPSLSESLSLSEIKEWKYGCFDWLYYETKRSKGKKIFRNFTVPFYDLNLDSEHDMIRAVFGMKYSQIYQRSIPILIFIEDNSDLKSAKIIRDFTYMKTLPSTMEALPSTIMGDYSRPCPPMCGKSEEEEEEEEEGGE